MAFNIVEAIQESDADCAFDQPCKFGHRVDGHAIYCHNDEWTDSPRKCRRTWYSGGETKDEDCPGFQPNMAFKGELCPTPLVGLPCSKCSGTKLFKVDRGDMETCPLCMGDGAEPTAIHLTDFQQNTLEMCCEHTGKHPAQFDYNQLMVDEDGEMEGLWNLEKLGLIQIRTVSHSKTTTRGVLYKMTPKGDAVMRANWSAAKK